MRFDRQIFFDQYRRHFGAIPAGKQYVVDGLDRLLTGFETYWGWWDDLRQIANALAQVKWETNHSCTPVVEGYYLGDPTKPGYFSGNTATVANFQKRLRYFPHFGRGDIQLTWHENYVDQDKRIRKWFPERVKEFEARTKKPFNLAEDPAQALDPWISFCIFTIGMHIGTFRAGHNLDRYITPTKTDHFNARDIVNGDKNYLKNGKKIGVLIAEDAKRFEAILNAALLPDEPQPLPAVPEFTPAEIETLTDAIGENEPATTLPSSLPIPVAQPEAAAPAGDQPIQGTSWLRVEDWKPFVLRWLRRIWGVNIPANVTQFAALGSSAVSDTQNWMIYVAIAVVLFILLSGGAILASAVLLAIWYVNRGEIKEAKTLSARSLADPSLGNIKVEIEKK